MSYQFYWEYVRWESIRSISLQRRSEASSKRKNFDMVVGSVPILHFHADLFRKVTRISTDHWEDETIQHCPYGQQNAAANFRDEFVLPHSLVLWAISQHIRDDFRPKSRVTVSDPWKSMDLDRSEESTDPCYLLIDSIGIGMCVQKQLDDLRESFLCRPMQRRIFFSVRQIDIGSRLKQ